MADRFRVGDKARVVYSICEPSLAGSIVTITKPRHLYMSDRINKEVYGYGTDCHLGDVVADWGGEGGGVSDYDDFLALTEEYFAMYCGYYGA